MRITATTLALAVLVSVSSYAEQSAPLTDTTVLSFASVEEGQAALGSTDRFIKALSKFDRQARLRSTRDDITNEEVMQLAASHVLPWQPEQITKFTKVIASMREKLSGYKLPLPETILLIQTSGEEEGNAAYTRENAIIFPKRYVEGKNVERILIHELFHVLSSQNAKLRHKLYAIIGFKPCPNVAMPASKRDLKLTNPDGPNLDSYIELDVDGEKSKAVPVLFANKKYAGGNFFQYLTFKLMVVENEGDTWTAVEEDGEPILIDPKSNESFHRQIGANTSYIIHPDEVLASNFEHFVLDTKDLKTPAIIEEMRALLR